MINNTLRCGNFTSSEIVALTSFSTDKVSWGKAALTYISEKNMERRLGRSIKTETDARALTWGKLLEQKAFDELGLEYILSSTETDLHPTIPFWAGSKDGIKHDPGKTILEIKCPLTLKSFCQLVDPIYNGYQGLHAMEIVREKHPDGDKFYWQMVSNSIINNCFYAELIVHVPYLSELDDVRLRAQMVEGAAMSKHYWIANAANSELPFLLDGGYYKNINIIRFEIPTKDKKYLIGLVKKAGKLLIGTEVEPTPAQISENILKI